MLVQELDVRVDKGFLLGLMEMFTNEKIRGTEVGSLENYKESAIVVSLYWLCLL